MVIGGAEDKIRDRVILGRFVELAGGEKATIAVISTASSLGARTTTTPSASCRASAIASRPPTS